MTLAQAGGPLLTLRSRSLEAVLAPAAGGRLAALRDHSGAHPRDIVVPMTDWPAEPRRWPKTGAYPLVPYSNRIADSRLVGFNPPVELAPHPDALPHTSHGAGHLRQWQGEQTSPTSATMTLEYAPDADWPWPFTARQTYMLGDDRLDVALSITNNSEVQFPAGLGWHPYFLWVKGCRIRHDARIRWLTTPDTRATGKRLPVSGRNPRTDFLSDWSRASLTYPDGLRLEISGSAGLGHLVTHRPPSDAYACIEPVSHVGDGFNLAERGIPGTGTIVLQPGAIFEVAASLHIVRKSVA